MIKIKSNKLINKAVDGKRGYKGYDIFYSKEKCYFINEDFLIVSNNILLLKKSLDCIDDKDLSIIEDEYFLTFTENNLTSNSAGFSYCNIPALKPDFLNKVPMESKDNWKALLDSMKYTGTSIELNDDKLELKTYLVHKENLTPFGIDFFSINSREFKSLKFFPRKTSNLIAVSEPDRALPLIFSLLSGVPGAEKFKDKAGSQVGLSLDYILSSLSEEITFSFYPEKGNNTSADCNKILFRNANIALRFKPDSSLNKMFQKGEALMALLSIIGEPTSYRDIDITSVPGGSATFSKLGRFLLFALGDSRKNTEDIIDTYYGETPSVEEHISSEISTDAIEILYLNMNELYSKYFSLTSKDEALKENLKVFFKKYPELLGSINTIEEGYLVNVVIPFEEKTF